MSADQLFGLSLAVFLGAGCLFFAIGSVWLLWQMEAEPAFMTILSIPAAFMLGVMSYWTYVHVARL